MNSKKSTVIKSKSSNSAITQKSDRDTNNNKKTKSSADFPPNTLKRRGVYVEKKSDGNKIGLPLMWFPGSKPVKTNRPKSPSPTRPPPRPKRDNKKFLTSVLTMLSKCSTSTQYPDGTNDPSKVDHKKKIKRRAISDTIQTTEQATQDEDTNKTAPAKYKSKILNEQLENGDPVIVIRGKKDVVQTPSNYTEISSKMAESNNKWLNVPIYTQPQGEKVIYVPKNKVSPTQKRLKIEEPATLVGESTKKEEKGLYNFFVDLLETTFSVYNVKTQYDEEKSLPPSENASKVAFEMDASVAKKLELHKDDPSHTDLTTMFNVTDDRIGLQDKIRDSSPKSLKRCRSPMLRSRSPVIRSRSPVIRSGSPIIRSRSPTKRSWSPATMYSRASRSPASKSRVSRSPARSLLQKMRTQSYAYTQQFKVNSPKTQSVIMPNKSHNKKSKKQTLLSMFREQLSMDNDNFDEPQNLFEALRVMARNKKRCRRAIQFDENVKHTNGDFDSECRRGRKVISSSTKSTRNRDYSDRNLLRTSSIGESLFSGRPKSVHTTDYDTDSMHSIEVVGYDFEPSPTRRRRAARNKEIVYAQSFTSTDDIERDFNEEPMIGVVKIVANSVSHNKPKRRRASRKQQIVKESFTSIDEMEREFNKEDAMLGFAETVANSVDHNRANYQYDMMRSISQVMMENLN